MIIAAAQIACVVGDVNSNMRRIRDFSQQAKRVGSEWIVFPEVSDTGYDMAAIREKATPWDGGAVPQIRSIARELNIGVVCGVTEREDDFIYNSQIVVGPDGDIITRYRKAHLFAPTGEDKCFQPGAALVTAKLGAFVAGISICYDLRFPELYRTQACERGVNLLLVSSAWPAARVAHMQVLTKARAIENQSYLVLSNRVGIDGKATFCGKSAIIDPLGEVVVEADASEEQVIHAKLDANVLAFARQAIPVFEQRRPGLYSAPAADLSSDSQA